VRYIWILLFAKVVHSSLYDLATNPIILKKTCPYFQTKYTIWP